MGIGREFEGERSGRFEDVPEGSRSVTGGQDASAPCRQSTVEGAPCRRLRFKEAMDAAEEQVGFPDEFGAGHRVWAHEVCQVMAEIYMMNPYAIVKISGEEREAGMVADIFSCVESHHVQNVVDKIIGGALDGVKNRRAYIRAILYNEVFEADGRLHDEIWGHGDEQGT